MSRWGWEFFPMQRSTWVSATSHHLGAPGKNFQEALCNPILSALHPCHPCTIFMHLASQYVFTPKGQNLCLYVRGLPAGCWTCSVYVLGQLEVPGDLHSSGGIPQLASAGCVNSPALLPITVTYTVPRIPLEDWATVTLTGLYLISNPCLAVFSSYSITSFSWEYFLINHKSLWHGSSSQGLLWEIQSKRDIFQDFPGGPVVKNPSCDAGETGSTPGWGTKIPHAVGQPSPHATTREPVCHNYRAHVLWSLHATTREKPMHHNEEPAPHNERSHMPQLRSEAANK